MYAVIKDGTILQTCRTREAALRAAQLEKEKAAVRDRAKISAVVMDDGGWLEL